MEVLEAALLMIALLGVSQVINRFVPAIPIPLVQIALGALVALIPTGIHMPLDHELFFLLFIAPLLYNDGKHYPRKELWRLKGPILLLAVGLVFIVVVVVGYAIHRLVPTIPLAAAFGLAAILSPTDAVAVSAMAKRVQMPKSLMRLLEGESLMNDASGLVAFKFAIAAAVTGVFSLAQASVSFVLVAVGGLLAGIVVAQAISWTQVMLRRFGMEDVTIHVIIQILTPFMIYMVAENIGVSGILAAVSGGLVHAIQEERTEKSLVKLHIVSSSTWSILLFVLNGLVFVLLGLQLPDAIGTIFTDPLYSNKRVFTLIGVIYLLLFVLRYAWVYLYSRWILPANEQDQLPSARYVLITTVSGVRGAVTLAGAFSIPFFLANGEAFPERDLIIFLAAGVILLSLIVASVVLPLITKKSDSSKEQQEEKLEKVTQILGMRAAIHALHEAKTPDNALAVGVIIREYRQSIRQLSREPYRLGSKKQLRKQMIELRKLALETERQAVKRLLAEEAVEEHTANQLLNILNQSESVLSDRSYMWNVVKKEVWNRFVKRNRTGMTEAMSEANQEVLRLKLTTVQEAIMHLKQERTQDNAQAVDQLITLYSSVTDSMQARLGMERPLDEDWEQQLKELRHLGLQAERDAIQTRFEQGQITRKLANKLRFYISYRESYMLGRGEI
ncbi:Na+/H+ antiporter [Paenibacillus aquistagni]|uniref:Sodium/proton antiporter, CPA1 family n=1 Tax=Paenibacillus aquistagni TaxID=1852522 RepID=A0A1X7LUF6_9BACL|nr:Na+/H+ antiporter [Paenibacillus aquistagni]SMG57465.1 sodium/proton antiporter, CPA1 family [Paenibacillus aquistagni]